MLNLRCTMEHGVRWSSREWATHVQIALRNDRDWGIVSTIPYQSQSSSRERRRRLAMTRLTRRALELFYCNATVSVTHGKGAEADWLIIRIDFSDPVVDARRARNEVRDFLKAVGIRYKRYNGGIGPRLCVRLGFNGAEPRSL